jgi:hypothetical protein
MRTTARFVLCFVVSLIIMPGALAQKRGAQDVSIAGIYGDFTVGKGSGDLEGMRVWILSAGNAYHAVVQIAEGGAEDPQPNFVPVTVKGTSVEFSVGEQKFAGTITAAGLRLKGKGLLKRQPCSDFF